MALGRGTGLVVRGGSRKPQPATDLGDGDLGRQRLDRGIAPRGRHACWRPCTQGSPAKPGSALGYRLVRPKAGEKRDAGSALACQPARRASRGVPWCAARHGGQAHGMGADSRGGASRIDVAAIALEARNTCAVRARNRATIRIRRRSTCGRCGRSRPPAR
jgi:hypothetical protein